MSWKVTAAVKEFLLTCPDERLRARHAALLYALADECRPPGFSCRPSLKRVARAARMSTRNASRLLNDLAAIGFIVIESRRAEHGARRANRYTLNLPTTLIIIDSRNAPSDYAETQQDRLSWGSQEDEGPTTPPQDIGVSKTEPQDTPVVGAHDTGVVGTSLDRLEGPPPPEETAGGGGGEEGSEEAQKQQPDAIAHHLGRLAMKLMELGVAEANVERIMAEVDHQTIRTEVARYISERKEGSRVGPGFLVDVIYGRKKWGAKLPKKAVDEERPCEKPFTPEPEEPPHEVTWHCVFCGTESACMSDESWHCPTCGASVQDQAVPDLVQKGIFGPERWQRVPARAREMMWERRRTLDSNEGLTA